MTTGVIGNALVRTFTQGKTTYTAVSKTLSDKSMLMEIFNEAGELITTRKKSFVKTVDGDTVVTKKLSEIATRIFPKFDSKVNIKQLVTRFFNRSTKEVSEQLDTYLETEPGSLYKWYSASRAGKSDVVAKVYDLAGEVADIKSAPSGNIAKQAIEALT